VHSHELPTTASRLLCVACRRGRRSTRGRSRRANYLRRPRRSLHRDWQSHSIMPARRLSTISHPRPRCVSRALGEGVLRRGVSRPALCLTERAKPGAKLCTRTVQVELESRCEHKAIRRSVRVKLQAQYPRYAQIFG